MTRPAALALVITLIVSPLTLSADTPRAVWVKEKCAVCHGIDGSGKTEAGVKLGVMNLRSPELQKLSDDELAVKVAGGYKRMPTFRKHLSKEQVRSLVLYIRSFATPAK